MADLSRTIGGLSFTPYIDTYVGAPVEELSNAVAQRQQLYDTNLAQATAIEDALGSIRALDGDSEFLKENLSPYMDRLNQLADSGDYEMALNDVTRLGRKFTKDENLRTIMDNYSAVEQYRNRLSELGSSALDFNPADGFSSSYIDPETGERKLRRFRADVEQRADYSGKMAQLMNNIRSDGSVTVGGANINIENLGIPVDKIPMIMQGRWEGISRDKVQRLASTLYDAYRESPEGNQDYRRLTELEGMDDNAARQDIINRLFAVGSPQIGSRTTASYTNIPDSFLTSPEASSSGEFEQLPYMENKIKQQVNPDNYSKINREKEMRTAIPGFPISYNNPTTVTSKKGGLPSYGDFSPVEKSINNTIANTMFGRNFDKLSDQQKDEALAKAGNLVQNIPDLISSDYVPVHPKEMTDQNKDITANIDSRKVFDPETGEVMDGATFKKELQGDFEDMEFEVIGRNLPGNGYRTLTGDDQFLQSYVVRVKGKDGKERVVAVNGRKSDYEDAQGRINPAYAANIKIADVQKARDFNIPVDISQYAPEGNRVFVEFNSEKGGYEVTVNGIPHPVIFPTPESIYNTL